jgi:hypothetical protein
MKKSHLLLVDSQLTGREYGTMIAFQEAIVKHTNA